MTYNLRTRTPDLETLLATATHTHVPEEVALAARDNLANGRCVALGFSAKQAGGKDTVAPAVLERLGIHDAQHVFFAEALKDEVTAMLADIRAAHDVSAGRHALRANHQLTAAQADQFIDLLWEPARAEGSDLTAYSRTSVMRTVLQFHGSDVRRKSDPGYWVVRTMPRAMETLAAGQSVYFTDCRFVNEVQLAQGLGATVIRLDITSETQAARLSSRDGITVSPAALTHQSETALDEYAGFDLRVDNNGSLETTVDTIAAFLQQ